MSTKKRARPSPAADSAEPEIDDAALRKALGDNKRAKSKAPFVDGACLGALTPSPTRWAANPMDDEDAAGAGPRAAESAALKPVMS